MSVVHPLKVAFKIIIEACHVRDHPCVARKCPHNVGRPCMHTNRHPPMLTSFCSQAVHFHPGMSLGGRAGSWRRRRALGCQAHTPGMLPGRLRPQQGWQSHLGRECIQCQNLQRCLHGTRRIKAWHCRLGACLTSGVHPPVGGYWLACLSGVHTLAHSPPAHPRVRSFLPAEHRAQTLPTEGTVMA